MERAPNARRVALQSGSSGTLSIVFQSRRLDTTPRYGYFKKRISIRKKGGQTCAGSLFLSLFLSLSLSRARASVERNKSGKKEVFLPACTAFSKEVRRGPVVCVTQASVRTFDEESSGSTRGMTTPGQSARCAKYSANRSASPVAKIVGPFITRSSF